MRRPKQQRKQQRHQSCSRPSKAEAHNRALIAYQNDPMIVALFAEHGIVRYDNT
jgi:hypothetical protein